MDVPASLRHELADRRRRGIGFANAWPPSLAWALMQADCPLERDAWAECLSSTQRDWRLAYQRRPASRMAVAVGALEDAA